jgi:hypothetical protein
MRNPGGQRDARYPSVMSSRCHRTRTCAAPGGLHHHYSLTMLTMCLGIGPTELACKILCRWRLFVSVVFSPLLPALPSPSFLRRREVRLLQPCQSHVPSHHHTLQRDLCYTRQLLHATMQKNICLFASVWSLLLQLTRCIQLKLLQRRRTPNSYTNSASCRFIT